MKIKSLKTNLEPFINKAPAILFVIYLLIPIILCGCTAAAYKKVCIHNVCLKAEIADSDIKRSQGLMFRKSLARNKGMLFVFEQEALHSIWMKNMHFPLDIIWIDANKRIVDIHKKAQPCLESCEVITPKACAKYVLELNFGLVDKNGFKIGDCVDF